jgi:ATP-binding cassette subfamily B protein
MDCGPTCLYMVSRFYGCNFSLEKLRDLTQIGKDGVNILGISDAAEKIGYRTTALQLTIQELNDIKLPAILHWSQNHFVVLYKSSPNKYFIADPGRGLFTLKEKEFTARWLSSAITGSQTGIALTIEPTPDFYNTVLSGGYAGKKRSFKNVMGYLYPYKKLIFQLIIGLLFGSLLQLVLPFLTQSVVDIGINTGDVPFIYVILLAQLALLGGRLAVEFIRSWILYHISTRINISILTDFLIKLMKLPVSYFDSKRTGDILQRMNDHIRIQNFLTGTSLTTLFSLFNLVVFSVVLILYNAGIFVVFITASVLYISWIFIFLKKRKTLDYKRFDIAASEQAKLVEIVQGMQ